MLLPPPHIMWESFNFSSSSLLIYWQLKVNCMATAQIAEAAALLLHHAQIGKSAMNIWNLLSKAQWSWFYLRPKYINRKRRKECSLPLWNFHKEHFAPVWGFFSAGCWNCCQNCQLKNKEALGNFKERSQEEKREGRILQTTSAPLPSTNAFWYHFQPAPSRWEGDENWEVGHFETCRISWESPKDLISYFLHIFQTK